MNKRGFVFIFSLLFLFPLLFTACSSNDSGSTKVIYQDTKPNQVVQGISIPSNYIELTKLANVDLLYDISAVAEPASAVNKKLIYTSSNSNIASVDGNGLLTIKEFGEFSVNVKSAANEGIQQKVDFYVAETILTPVDTVKVPLSIFGNYVLVQYGINKMPDQNIGGVFTLGANKTVNGVVNSTLYLNGAKINMDLNKDEYVSLSYDAVALDLIKSINAVKSSSTDSDIVISLKGENIPFLTEEGIISEKDTLYVSLKKISDLNPGQQPSNINIDTTKISLGGDRKYDRKDTSLFLIKPVIYPNNTSNPGVKFESSNEKVATVSAFGKVNILDKGEADITAVSTSNDKVFDKIKVTVVDTSIAVKDIIRNENIDSVLVGKTINLSGKVIPEDATFKNIVYTSKNPDIAEVNSITGIVKGKKKGKAVITSVADNGRFVKEYTVNVEAFAFPVTGIMNIPYSYNMSMVDTFTINPIAFPEYAFNKALSYKITKGSDVISFDESSKTIKPIKEGEAELTVYSADNEDVSKSIEIYVRKDVQEVEVSSITLNHPPANLYVNNTTFDLTAEVNKEANINRKLMVESSHSDIVAVYPKDDVTNQWTLSPVGEGSAEIRVYSKSGVEQKFTINAYKIMNTKGYYKINKVVYSYNGIQKEMVLNQDDTTKDKMAGEFGIDINDNNISFKGRIQHTPHNPFVKESYTFNNWRFLYIEKNINLDKNDKFANQIKSIYENNGIQIKDSKHIEYTYNDNGFSAHIYLEKVSDVYSDIPDKTVYVTPLDIKKDPKSIEGYYEMEFFYGNPWNKSSTGYQPVFSGTGNDRPTSSDLNISYLHNGRKCALWITCLGGNGADGSVTNYSGAFTVKVSGVNESAKLSSIMKVQKQGHHDYDFNPWLKYIHGTFGDTEYNQSVPYNSHVIVNKNLMVDVYGRGNTGAYIAYKPLENDTLQFETQFYGDYQFTYRAKKVSDRYIDLPTTRFVNGDITGRAKPVKPSLIEVEPVTDKTGSATDIL